MSTRLAGPLCRDPRCNWAPLEDLIGEAARGTVSLRVDAALLDGWPVRGAAARSFGKAAFGDRGGIPYTTGDCGFRACVDRFGNKWWSKKTSGPTVSSLVELITVYMSVSV